jgi:hypothetical protein
MSEDCMLSFVILYAVALWVLSSWLRLPTKVVSVPTRAPYSHHDVVIARSKALTAYADFINDCTDDVLLLNV